MTRSEAYFRGKKEKEVFGLVVLVVCGRNFKTACKAVWRSQAIAFNETAKLKFLLKKTKQNKNTQTCKRAKMALDYRTFMKLLHSITIFLEYKFES